MAIPPFDIQQIPDAMRKESMPIAARLMEHWFNGKLNAQGVETGIVKLNWVLKFAHAKESYEYLVDTAIRSPEAQGLLAEMLFPYRNQSEVLPANLCGNSPSELHKRFHFQSAGVGGTLHDNLIRQLRAGRETFASPSDLVAGLGAFNICAAVGHVRFSSDRTSLSGTRIADVTGVWIYVRDNYGFSEQSRYIGHWSRDGLITLPHDEAVTIGNPLGKGNIRYPVYENDFHLWSGKHQRGSDFVAFSDRRWVPVSPPIRLYLRGDAQPFDYKPLDAPNDDVEQVAGTTDEKYARKMYGYDSSTFREMIHRFKRAFPVGANQDLEFEENGDVYFNGEYLDNFHDYGD
jgi:hypothetical protein